MDILRELRFVAREVGLAEARKLSVEVRRWWIDQMNQEVERKNAEYAAMQGQKTVPV